MEGEAVPRWIAGACGGLAAAAVKYVGQDHQRVTEFLAAGQSANAISLGLGYAILVPILMLIGGLVGFFSDEQQRMKLFAMGVAAPALITTWANGIKVDLTKAVPAPAAAEARELAAPSPSVLNGVRMFFGYRPQGSG